MIEPGKLPHRPTAPLCFQLPQGTVDSIAGAARRQQ
jgi:hypothetical protein